MPNIKTKKYINHSAALLVAPVLATAILLVLTLTGQGLGVANKYGFTGTAIQVTLGHAITLYLTMLYVYGLKKSSYAFAAPATVTTQLFWRWMSSLSWLDCSGTETCGTGITESQNRLITVLVAGFLVIAVYGYYVLRIKPKTKK